MERERHVLLLFPLSSSPSLPPLHRTQPAASHTAHFSCSAKCVFFRAFFLSRPFSVSFFRSHRTVRSSSVFFALRRHRRVGRAPGTQKEKAAEFAFHFHRNFHTPHALHFFEAPTVFSVFVFSPQTLGYVSTHFFPPLHAVIFHGNCRPKRRHTGDIMCPCPLSLSLFLPHGRVHCFRATAAPRGALVFIFPSRPRVYPQLFSLPFLFPINAQFSSFVSFPFYYFYSVCCFSTTPPPIPPPDSLPPTPPRLPTSSLLSNYLDGSSCRPSPLHSQSMCPLFSSKYQKKEKARHYFDSDDITRKQSIAG